MPVDSTTFQAKVNEPWLRIARVSWIILAAAALLILFSSLPGYFQKITGGIPGHGFVDSPSSGFVILQVVNTITSLMSGVLSLFLAGLLFRNRFENPAIMTVSFYLLLYGTIMTGPLEAWGSYWIGSVEFALNLQSVLMATPTLALLALFPNGKFVPAWTRWLLVISVPWNILAILFPFTNGDILSLIILGSLWITLLGMGLYAQIFRYKRESTVDERQQTKWVLFGFVLWMGYIFLSTYPYFYLINMPPGTPYPWWASLSEFGWWISLNIFPASMAIAIMRSRLWNIDIVINRTIVYGALTFVTIALYIFIVGTLGNLLHLGDNTFVAFLTTGLVAVLFQPLRNRLQRWVNRLMYGERDDPVAVLSKLGDQLDVAGSPEDTLAGIVKTVATTLKFPYVAIELGNDHDVVASYGVPKTDVIYFPMQYQNKNSGYLAVAPRSSGEAFSSSERKLLESIAQQAGAVAHTVKLTTDLQVSRQNLVTAREEERRHMRRDLHDGLGPVLASQGLKMAAVSQLINSDPARAKEMLEELASQNETTVGEVRRLVYGLRPAALDELGLVSAVREYAAGLDADIAQIGLIVKVHEPEDGLPSLPAAVEVAAYRIATEALTNVFKHAEASLSTVTFSVNSETQEHVLALEIEDDGSGLPDKYRSGIGLGSMRERAEELGGEFLVESNSGSGTKIVARLPYKG